MSPLIAKLAKEEPDRIAIENFCCSLHGLTEGEALANLQLDAESYGWNGATIRAIRAGIADHYAPVADTLRISATPLSFEDYCREVGLDSEACPETQRQANV